MDYEHKKYSQMTWNLILGAGMGIEKPAQFAQVEYPREVLYNTERKMLGPDYQKKKFDEQLRQRVKIFVDGEVVANWYIDGEMIGLHYKVILKFKL